ncbi:hypothetical protein BJ138DRAFT_1088702 [Hygrophoropsis aurantiaca]|uniref:Uncharacterized protein n=1 Tax=Hygrophoropsis aurantiaca TaxID=72124 RepID=A0ACB8A9W2_9AGAM|nr:hypothetical protein BJ138DRAFT_1088702 [Hygrophoropsis aurantiaca]
MHQTLHIEELLCHIFAQITDPRTLFSLACTCQTFKDPALNALYFQIDNFTPLIKCLPRDLWISVKYVLSHEELIFIRPMNPNDWNVFQTYANRVKRLSYLAFSKAIRPDVLDSLLSQLAPMGIMFPKLQALNWDDGRVDAAKVFRLLLGSPLVDFSIGNFKDNSYTPDFFPCLLPPSVKSLDLGIGRADHVVASHLICQAYGLERLRCSVLTQDDMLHLATLPSLRTLEVQDLVTSSQSKRRNCLDGRPAFQNLQSLSICSDSLLECFNLIHAIQQEHTTPLVHLFAAQHMPPTDVSPAAASKLLEILSSIYTTSTLSRIFIDVRPRDGGRLHLPPISIDVIAHLFVFRNLTVLDLEFANAFMLDDDDLTRMARAWPNLLELRLGEVGHWKMEKRITFAGFYSLIELCSNLRELSLSIDATVGLSRLIQPRNRSRNMKLRELWFYDSPIQNPAQVAVFVSDILPNVKFIYASYGPLTPQTVEYEKKWKETVRLLKFFALARKQERLRCGYLDDDEMLDPFAGEGSSSGSSSSSEMQVDDDDADEEDWNN